MTKKDLGCEYGRTNRIFIEEIKQDISTIKENTNHYSKRLPEWAIAVIGLLTSIIGFVIGVKI